MLGQSRRRTRLLASIERHERQGGEKDIRWLGDTLRDEDPALRERAAHALGRIGNPAGLPYLLQTAYEDKDLDVRIASIQSLGWIGQASVISSLNALLMDPHQEIRLVTVMTLGWINSPLSTSPLLRALEDSDRTVRSAATGILEELDNIALDDLLVALNDENRTIRHVVAGVLKKHAPALTPQLLHNLCDQHSRNQRASQRAIVYIGEQAVPDLLNMMNRPENVSCQRILRDTLLQIGGAAVPELLLVVASHKVSLNERRLAAQTLVNMGDEQTTRMFMVLLEADTALEEIVQMLQGIDGATIRYLLPCMRFDQPKTHEIIRKILRGQGDKFVPVLIEELNSDDRSRFVSAAWALGIIGNRAATLGLLRALRDNDWMMRWAAARALGVIGNPDAIPGLARALHDADSSICMTAACALAAIGEPALPALFEALRDRDARTRWAAAVGLAEVRLEDIQSLLQTWRNADPALKRTVTFALSEVQITNILPPLPEMLQDEISKYYKILGTDQGIDSTGVQA